MQISSVRLGLIFGLFLAIVHAAWALLVAIGWAQPFLDFVFWAHFITPPYQVEAFEFVRAAVLTGFVFIVGLVFGVVGGCLWNMSTRAK